MERRMSILYQLESIIAIGSRSEKNDESMRLHTLGLLQQFSIESYVKLETYRLYFQQKRQNDIWIGMIEGVLDKVAMG